MKRDDLHIPKPCDADWSQMTGDERRRYCSLCSKDVHNLSELTQRDAAQLLDDTNRNLCVQYAVDTRTDEILFTDSPHRGWRLRRQIEGAGRLIAAAALAAPLLLAACDTPEDTSAHANAPVIQIEDGQAPSIAKPGAGRAVAPPVEPSESLNLLDESLNLLEHIAQEIDGDVTPIQGQLMPAEIPEPVQHLTSEVIETKGDLAPTELEEPPEFEGSPEPGEVGCDTPAIMEIPIEQVAPKEPVRRIRGRVAPRYLRRTSDHSTP